MTQYSPQGLKMLPTGVKNLLIINVLCYLASAVLQRTQGLDLSQFLALHSVFGADYHPWQYFTFMFMHGSIEHLVFNMFALWMFGYTLENIWGTRRFVIFYLVCGTGAGIIHSIITGIDVMLMQNAVNDFAQSPSPDALETLLQSKFRNMHNASVAANFISEWRMNPVDAYGTAAISMMQDLVNSISNIPTVGASGAVFGILLAFGLMFPDSQIYLYILLPIKAKWFVIGYGVIELLLGIFNTSDHIAHFAHLGGMLFGFLMLLWWRKHDSYQRWD